MGHEHWLHYTEEKATCRPATEPAHRAWGQAKVVVKILLLFLFFPDDRNHKSWTRKSLFPFFDVSVIAAACLQFLRKKNTLDIKR